MRYILTLMLSLVVLASCSDKKEPEAHEDHHEETGSNIVSLTKEQIKAVKLEIGTVEMKNLKSSISANGILTVPNQNKAHVTPLYSGVVRSLFVQPGNTVREGQAIATIVNTDLVELQQELLSVNSQITLAETEHKRQKELVEGNASPLKRLQQVEAELRSLEARKAGVTERLRAFGYPISEINSGKISSVLTITAPISGTVSEVNAEIGSNVNASSPIAEIVNNSQLHLDVFVYEKDLPFIEKNQVIHFTLTNNPGVEYDAKIYSIGTSFASETKTIPVHAMVVGDKTGLIEGMNITAVISLGDAVVPSVPSDAIVNSQGQDYIFIQLPEEMHAQTQDTTKHTADEHEHHEGEEHDHGGEHPKEEQKGDQHEDDHKAEATGGHGHNEVSFERIPIRKGVTAAGYTEITPLKELPANAKIVTKGAFFLIAKMTNSGEGHAH